MAGGVIGLNEIESAYRRAYEDSSAQAWPWRGSPPPALAKSPATEAPSKERKEGTPEAHPAVPLLRAPWSRTDGIWGILNGQLRGAGPGFKENRKFA